MSEKSLDTSNDNKNKISKNIQSSKIYYNQIINKFDLNNIISNSSISINDSKLNYNDKEENNLHNISFLNKSFEIQYKAYTDNYNIISKIYQELLSLITESNKYSLFNDENEKNKNIKILNDKNSSKESIINIFKKTFIKIIDSKTKELKESIKQYKSYILLLEQTNRFFIQQNFLKQTKIDILENEIDSYMEMEEEFDEMKEKFKYENGKFLHNEKKENEILILRAENSNLKKIIDKNEKTIEEKELIIESIKNKSLSMINTNKNTMKNSFDENENSSLIINHKNRLVPKQKLSHNNSNINNLQKINSPINNEISNNLDNFKTNINNNYNSNKSFHIKKISYGENLGSKLNTKDLINKKLKNKVLNMKKIRRINNSGLDMYNKSSVHITNSIMSSNSNNSNSKRIKKKINSFYKNSKNNINSGISKIHKKLSSGLTNSNINNDSRMTSNILKNNNNKIIVNSILDNNDTNKIKKINNNKSFLLKTSDKKFYISKKKKKSKAILKTKKDELILERNSYSLIKSPTTFNSNNIENSIGMKNNIIINNIIQNSSVVPASVQREQSKSKEKINVSEFEQKQNLSHRIINNKSSFLPVNIKKKKNKK